MKLNYNILCVDDEIERLTPLKTKITQHNSLVGITTEFFDVPVIREGSERRANEKTDEEFKTRIKRELDQRFNNNLRLFDLILVDLHLTPEKEDGSYLISGPDIIEWIRETHTIYRPIIFYSGGTPPSDQRAKEQLLEASEVHDIFGKNLMITTRNQLENKLKRVVNEMHAEEHKVNSVRGLLMDRVSEIDAVIIKALTALWDNVPQEKQDEILTSIQVRLKKRSGTAERLSVDASSKGYSEILPYLLEDIRRWDVNMRSLVLRKVLKQLGKDNAEALLQEFHESRKGNTNRPLTALRNSYAHIVTEEIDASHGDETCKYIREESRKHLANVLSLLDDE